MRRDGGCVLIVDDDRAQTRAIGRALKRIGGYSSTSAHTVDEAVDAIARGGPFHLAVVDILFNGVPRGFEIAAIAQAKGIPVAAITGSEAAEHANRCLQTGLPYIRKPWDDATLLHVVRRAREEALALEEALDAAINELTAANALSPFERRLASAIARGVAPGAFQAELGVSLREMNNIRARLFDKCGWPGIARPNAGLYGSGCWKGPS